MSEFEKNSREPANPFMRAIEEGALGTWSAMLEAGLDKSFEPMPKSERGAHWLGWMLSASFRGESKEKEWALKALEAGLDPLGLMEPPFRHGDPKPAAIWAIGAEEPARSALGCWWKKLSAEQLKSLGVEALCEAVDADHREAMQALLKAGVSPNGEGSKGLAPAQLVRDVKALELLIDAGADPRFKPKNQDGVIQKESAAVWEVIMRRPSQSVVEKQIKDRAIQWIKDRPEGSHEEIAKSAFEAMRRGNKDAAKKAIQALGIEQALAARSSEGKSLAIAAIQANMIPLASQLIAAGADPLAVDDQGRSILAELCDRMQPRGNDWRSNAAEKAMALAEKIFNKKKLNWTQAWSASAEGRSLLSSMMGKAPFEVWKELADRAMSQGWSPSVIANSHGLSMRGLLLMRAVARDPWMQGSTREQWRGWVRKNGGEAILAQEQHHRWIMKLWESEPSSEEELAKLAQAALDQQAPWATEMLQSAKERGWARHRDLSALARIAEAIRNENDDEVSKFAAQKLQESCAALGRSGGSIPATQWLSFGEQALSWVEQGALEATADAGKTKTVRARI